MLKGFERDIILSRAHCTTLVCFYDLWWSSLYSGKLHYRQNVTTCDQIKLWAAKSGVVSCSNLTCKKVPETIKLQDFGLWPKFEWLVYPLFLRSPCWTKLPPMFCWNLSNSTLPELLGDPSVLLQGPGPGGLLMVEWVDTNFWPFWSLKNHNGPIQQWQS